MEWLYHDEELGIFLDISRISFSDEFIQAMQPKVGLPGKRSVRRSLIQKLKFCFIFCFKFEKAFKDMAALEGGSIANPDEGRMVGHYWLRTPELSPNPTIQKNIVDSLEAVDTFAKGIVAGTVSAFVSFLILWLSHHPYLFQTMTL